jgi:two-component system, NarL family, nitrate/nitrite response regulator NarL
MTRNLSMAATVVPTHTSTMVAVFSNDTLLMEALRKHAPSLSWSTVTSDSAIVTDVVIMDSVPLRPVNIDKIAALHKRGIASIVVTESVVEAKAAVAAGARGVLLRSQCADGATSAVAAVRNGLQVVDIAFADAWTTSSELPASRGNLTDREYQVVQLLAEGLSNKLIADRLGISDHTAKFHVNGVMVKLGASTRTEAVVAAMRQGVVKI